MKNKKSPWPPCPRSLTERGYRRFMAKIVELPVRINGEPARAQQVSPKWYYRNYDRFGNGKDSYRYADELLRNTIVHPREIANEGMEYFDARDDLETGLKLVSEVENFLGNASTFDAYTGKDTSATK